MGLGAMVRAPRLIAAAATYHAGKEIRYTGIDPFETRGAAAGPPLSLKVAYRRLTTSGARVQLVPGQPRSTLVHMANHLGRVDLVVISATDEADDLGRMWSYLPRVLHERSLVFIEEQDSQGGIVLKQLSLKQITAKADRTTAKRKAA